MTLSKSQILMLLLLTNGSTTIGMEMKTFKKDVEFLKNKGLVRVTTISAPVIVTEKGWAVIDKYTNLEV